MKKFLVIIPIVSILFFLFSCDQPEPFAPNAQENQNAVQLSAQVNQESCSVGQIITLQINLKTSGSNDLPEPRASGEIKGFRIRGQSQQNSIRITNGKRVSAVQIVLELQAVKAGSWTIPPFEVKSPGGLLAQTQAIQITVEDSPGNTVPQSKQERPLNRLPQTPPVTDESYI